MKLNFIEGGEEAFDALVYRPPSTAMVNHINSYLPTAIETMTNHGSQMVGLLKDLHHNYNSDEVLNASKRLLQSLGTASVMRDDVIIPLAGKEIPKANTTMINYIMANPTINKLYQENLCAGYDEKYVNQYSDLPVTENPYYTRTMDGVLTSYNDNDEDDTLCIKHYSSSDEIELDTLDKWAIFDTWDNVILELENGKDVTDPYYEDDEE